MSIFHRDKKKSTKKKTDIFKKVKLEHGALFWVIGILIFLFALNVAIEPLNQLSSLFYEVEIWIISFLSTPIHLQLWFVFTILFLALVSGYVVMPVLTIPSTGEVFLIRRTWQEGEKRKFITWKGRVISTHIDNESHKFWHYFIYKDVIPMWYQGEWLYQTRELEVLRSELSDDMIQVLADQLALYQESEANREARLSIDEIKELLAGKRGGEE